MKILPRSSIYIFLAFSTLFIYCSYSALAQTSRGNNNIDEKVKQFLNTHFDKWIDMNIPTADGQQLYDIIIKNNYKKALEIGTSTGHSAIWMAWALSKTGGTLITIEIDEKRYKNALANFKEAGLYDYIDAQLGNAHKIVPALSGTFDFIFCDADKNWYKNYFIAMSPKIEVGGTYTAHNVASYGRTRQSNRGGTTRDFFNYVIKLPNYSTTVNNLGAGMSVSIKKGEDIYIK